MVKRKVKGYKNTLHLQFRTVTFQIYKFNLAFKSFDICLAGRGRLGPNLTKILDYSPLQLNTTQELQRMKFRASFDTRLNCVNIFLLGDMIPIFPNIETHFTHPLNATTSQM